jgi:hypothetical protein
MRGRLVAIVDLLPHLAHMRHDRPKVDLGLADPDAKRRKPARGVYLSRNVQERLARDAAPPGALAAEPVALDQDGAGAKRGATRGGHQPGRPATDDRDIDMHVLHPVALSPERDWR